MVKSFLIYAALILYMISCDCFAQPDDVDAFKVLMAIVNGQNSISKCNDEQDRKIVQFWLNAIRKDNAIECSIRYIQQLRKKITRDKLISKMTNLDQIYNYAECSIMEYCSKGVIEQGRRLAVDLDAKLNLLQLTGSQFNNWIHGAANREDEYEIRRSFRFMAEWMLHVIGTDKRNNQKEFIEAWKNGPCREVMHQLEKPNMISFRNFVRLVDETKFDAIANLASPSKYYVPMVQCCRFYQSDGYLFEVWKILQQRHSEIEEHVRAEASFDYSEIEAFDEDD